MHATWWVECLCLLFNHSDSLQRFGGLAFNREQASDPAAHMLARNPTQGGEKSEEDEIVLGRLSPPGSHVIMRQNWPKLENGSVLGLGIHCVDNVPFLLSSRPPTPSVPSLPLSILFFILSPECLKTLFYFWILRLCDATQCYTPILQQLAFYINDTTIP